MVLKMGSPGRYCGAQTFNTIKISKYVARLYYDYKQINQIRKILRMIRKDAGTENSLVKDIQILLRYQHDDKDAGPRSFSLCRSSAHS